MTKKEFLDKLSDYVIWRRNKMGLSQTELAKRIDSKGIDNNYISRLEHKATKGCRLSTICLILDALNGTVDFKNLLNEGDKL